MISNWDKSFDLVIKSEGGFTNDERDPGNKLPDGRKGCTMLGCTQANWERFINKQVTQDDMKKLTPSDVKPLYKANYWDAVKGDELPSGVDYAVFDFAINSGPGQSRKTLQRALRVIPDGVLGQNTLKAIQAADGTRLLEDFSIEKTRFYQGLAAFDTYGKGWLKRVAEVKEIATKMLA